MCSTPGLHLERLDAMDEEIAAPRTTWMTGTAGPTGNPPRTIQTGQPETLTGETEHISPTGLLHALYSVRNAASDVNEWLPRLNCAELASLASTVEELSRFVDYLQVGTAAAMDRGRVCAEMSGSWTTAAGKAQQEFKSTADYMRQRLRISRREAWRRICLGSALMPATSLTGQRIEPELAALSARVAQGLVSGQAAQTVSVAMKHVQGCGSPEDRASMEEALTEVAVSQDLDALTVVASAWVNQLDPDGTEPSEQQKAELQGLFIRRKYRGMHRLDIFATEDQFETLMTALSPETSPRNDAGQPADGACVDLEGNERAVPADRRSYPQKCLDGLVSSCRIALSSGQLPANGGSKPQVLAIVPYEQLQERVGRKTESGMLAFAGPVPPHQIRRIACEADIIPVVLSGEGRILDVGSASRYFPPHLRKALTARDGGCAFPGCTSPAPWCEAHHIEYYSRGGATSTDNGVLLCGFHHHLIHREKWRIRVRNGVPWFIPPTYVDPFQAPLRNTYFHPLRRDRQTV
ncbi:DUF222 domain-containing protein [Arthrobacter sp. zg-Y820]|uniref:HNH endonuclease signature motif containing protein n=2 Tax=Arthrobacter TaxID=1663 RepID=UPI0032E7FE66